MSQPINDYGAWLADPHVQAVNAAPLVEQPGFGAVPIANIPGLPAIDPKDHKQLVPTLGQHSREILTELDYSADDFKILVEQGCVSGNVSD